MPTWTGNSEMLPCFNFKMDAIFDLYSLNDRPKEHCIMILQTFASLDLLIEIQPYSWYKKNSTCNSLTYTPKSLNKDGNHLVFGKNTITRHMLWICLPRWFIIVFSNDWSIPINLDTSSYNYMVNVDTNVFLISLCTVISWIYAKHTYTNLHFL